MLIAISARGSNPDDIMEDRFGRATGFMIHDTEKGTFEFLDNSAGAVLPQGAGIQSAQTLADRGVRAVVSGSIGPKAFAVLEAAGVAMLTCSGCSVNEAAARFRHEELTSASAGPADAGKAGVVQQQGAGQYGAQPGMAAGCRRLGGAGMGMGRGGGRGMGGGGRGMGGGGRGMGGRGMGGGGMGRSRG